MHLNIPHKFTQQEGVARVRAALNEGREKLGDKGSIDEERWEGSTLHFAVSGQGQHVSGTLKVKEKEFMLDATLPFMMRFFEGKIEKAILEQAKQLLG